HAPRASRHAAVGGIVQMVAHDEEMAGGHDDVRHIVELALCGHLEDRMLMSAGQCLADARGAYRADILGLHRARACGLNSDSLAVDADLAVAHTDTIAGQSNHALYPNLRDIAGPAENGQLTPLWAE